MCNGDGKNDEQEPVSKQIKKSLHVHPVCHTGEQQADDGNTDSNISKSSLEDMSLQVWGTAQTCQTIKAYSKSGYYNS